MTSLERELDCLATKVGLKVRGHVDVGRFAGGVLDDQEQLGDYLDDVTGLKDKVALSPLHALRGEATRDVGLTTQLAGRASLKKINK